MIITANQTIRIAMDGIGYKVATLTEGESMDVEQKLAESLIESGAAVAFVEEKKIVSAPENKAIESAPKVKRSRK